MASEDSDELVPGLAPVHRHHHLHDLGETVVRQMFAGSDSFHAVRKLQEVESLVCLQRRPPEKRNDPIQQIVASTDQRNGVGARGGCQPDG